MAEPYDPYRPPPQQGNPFQPQNQPQPEWSGAGGSYTSGGGAPQGSVYNSFTPQTQQRGTPSPWYANTAQPRPPAQPSGYNYPQSGNYTNPAQPAWGAPQAPRGSGASGVQTAADNIARAYQQYLGRNATRQEIDDRIRQPGFNLNTHVQAIRNSPEAATYAQRPQASQPVYYPEQGQGGWDQVINHDPGRFNQPYIDNVYGPPPQGGQPPPDPRRWNTDGYTRPAYIAQRPSSHPPAGFERAKWNDPNHQTPKYVVGRILSQYKPRTENMDAVVAEISRAYPGTRRTGSGDITIPGIGSADILKAADVGGKAWHFGGGKGGGKAPLTPGAQQVQQGAMDPYTQLLQTLTNPQYLQGPGRGQEGIVHAPDPAAQQQIAAMQAQIETLQAQAQAASGAARRVSPQFNYF
jgi:hypothetical protein